MSGSENEGFLSRWSRRKRTRPAEETPEETPEAEASPAENEPPGNDPEDEAAVLERLGLPDPDTLERGADFAVFMRSAVPEAIRRRALRRLWRSNPTLAVLDGLNDYDDDFRGGFVKPGTLRTAYRVGRGFLDTVADLREADAEGEDREVLPAGPAASSLREPDRPDEAAVGAIEGDRSDGGGEQADERVDPEPAAPPAAPARRRMAFRFDDRERDSQAVPDPVSDDGSGSGRAREFERESRKNKLL